MKIKKSSKAIAVVLSAVMTFCLTACEDERGSTVRTEQKTGEVYIIDPTKPRVTVELEESHIDDSDITNMLCLHFIIDNNCDVLPPSELISVKVVGGDGAKYFRPSYDGEHYDWDGITDKVTKPGYSYRIPYGFETLLTNSDTATVTVTDRSSGEVIGEWTVNVKGIMGIWDNYK